MKREERNIVDCPKITVKQEGRRWFVYDDKSPIVGKGISEEAALKCYHRGLDLLQQKKNISRNVTANFITDREYNDLTRYFMFTVTWKFNTFGSSSQIPEMRGPRMGGRRNGPPPPPPGAF